ncbi:MAG: adenylate/guanylate cyclase domain-containing protein [candidate division WOR-3 bacterium]
MRCYNCGIENPENSNYCLNCGVSLKYMLLPERRVVCVMFVDLVNFTRISENRDPEDVLALLNTLFTRIERIVVNHDGTIDKYLGDGVMILFGTPVAHEDDVERALRCSLDILQDVKNSNLYLNENIEIKISLNVGTVICGFTGGTHKRMYTVIGDDVNVAEKINDFARPNSIVVTEKIVEYASHTFEFKNIGVFKIQGKEEPLKLFELTGLKPRDVIYSSFKGKLVPLVNRRDELNKLITGVKEVVEGKGISVILTGEAGVGKSRMKYEIKKYCRENFDFLILEANCRSYYRESLYQPLVEILTQFFNINLGEEIESKNKKVLENSKHYGLVEETIFPLKNILGIETTRLEKEKVSLEDSFTSLLNKVSQKKPILLIFEDIQWIDDGTLEILKNLLKQINTLRVFILLTYRPARRIALPDIPNLVTIWLPNLSREETSLLISELIEVERVPESIVDLVFRKTEGNPLFIEELVERLYKDGVFEINEKKEVLIKRNLSEITIPDKITSLFLEDIDRLPPNIKNIVKIASVIGRDFNREILQELLPEEDLNTHLQFLEDSGLVFKDREKENRYFFKHSFVREAVYSLLPRKEQRELHYKVANAMEKIFEDRLTDYYEVLSYHYEIAESYDKSFYYNLYCGKNYLRAGMYAAARNKLKKAEEMLKKLGEVKNQNIGQVDRFELYFELAKVNLNLGFLGDCLRYCEIAMVISTSLQNTEKTKEALQIFIRACLLMGDYDSLTKQLKEIKYNLNEETALIIERLSRLYSLKSTLDESSLIELLELTENVEETLKIHLFYALLDNLYHIKEKRLLKKFCEYLENSYLINDSRIQNELEILKIYALTLCGNYGDAEKKIEIMKSEDRRDLSDFQQILLLILESRLKREQGEFAEAQKLLSLAKSMSDDSSNILLRAKTLFELGKVGFFYSNEYVAGLNNFISAVDSYSNAGESKEKEICKMFIWLANLLLGNPTYYEQVKLNYTSLSGILANNFTVLQVIQELLSGNFEWALTKLSNTNLNHVESEILVTLAYTCLLLIFVKEIETLMITLERILFLLGSRNHQIFENAHLEVITAIYHGVIRKNFKSPQYSEQLSENSPALMIRETRILMGAVKLNLDELIASEEKMFYFEDLSTQAEILKSTFTRLLVEFIKLQTSHEPQLLTQIRDNIEKMLKVWKFNNLVKLLNS